MPFPLRAPRVNNNDDIVEVVALRVAVGDHVKKGEVVLDVETDKAVVEVAAEEDGYVLKLMASLNEKVPVGSVLLWQGARRDEPVPETPAAVATGAAASGPSRPTAKARALLQALGLDAASVPASGERLTHADVEAFAARRGLRPVDRAAAKPITARRPPPDVPGEFVELNVEERGMLSTVSWARDEAAATYLEVEYDPTPWDQHAAAYAQASKLMLSPLLPLLAFRLVQLVKARPKLNATVVDGKRYQYASINLGFTVQAAETLYLTVVRNAETLDPKRFIDTMGEVQRRALQRKLSREETTGATVAFSSMARWNVSRHVPILPPHCSLMVAHAAAKGAGRAVLGASYDHRILSGFDAARLLGELAKPPKE
jgi:pyruvate/2-oxoglutarate dehydrogenase complex dihydrolipoamide acyltransferase (E2) component